MSQPNPFEIARHGDMRTASNGEMTLSVLEPEALLFRRRAIKRTANGESQMCEWAVAELKGVRVYIDGRSVVVTERDLMP